MIKIGIVYPGGVDSFNEPSLPEATPLSEAGSASRNHTEHHRDLGDAVESLEGNASFKTHDHSGDGTTAHGNKLLQSNTHEQSDTDVSVLSIHHTLGPGPGQAAPGNHAHDYQGPSIFNQPLLRCTSTTRPVAPTPGLMIYETDTNCMRVWAAFPGNTYVPPQTATVNYDYDFHEYISNVRLDPEVWDQNYVFGTSGPGPNNGGYMANPAPGVARWIRGGDDETARCIARNLDPEFGQFLSDDQEIVFKTGNEPMDHIRPPAKGDPKKPTEPNDVSPTNDVYLRMSDDGQSYVRFALGLGGVGIIYTNSGPGGEVMLSGVEATTDEPNTEWTAKCIGDTYLLYHGHRQIVAAVDYTGAINKGENYRGWGIGMTAISFSDRGDFYEIGQVRPNDLKSLHVVHEAFPTHTTNFLWQLMSGAATPVFRAEARTDQEIRPDRHDKVRWTHVVEDWFGWIDEPKKIMKLDISDTDMVITEPGHYHILGAVHWNPQETHHDHSMIGVEVNGIDIARKNWKFVRGYDYTPGFAQTHAISIYWYLALGDTVRLIAAHNANRSSWLWWSPDYSGHNAQVCHIELVWDKP